jgi:hypothetical protein
MTPEDVSRFLLDELRGLAWDGGWVKEAFWYEALGRTLREQRGVAATIDRKNPYPDGSGFCDLVIPLFSGEKRFWIESKGVWWRVGSKPAWTNSNSRGHLLSRSKNKHSALRDVIEKLPLITDSGSWVGELLVGFDSYESPIPEDDIAKLVDLGGLTPGKWMHEYREWPCRMSFAHRIRVWFWYREAVTAS